MKRVLWPIIGSILVLIVFASIVLTPSLSGVQAAPHALPTPLAYDNSKTTNKVVRVFSDRVLVADNTQCVNLTAYDNANLQIVIDQASINTTTLKLLYSGDGVHYTTGPTIVNANTIDLNDIYAAPLYMRDTCVFADTSNSNPVTVTVLLEAN